MAASSEVLSCLRKLSTSLDIVRTARFVQTYLWDKCLKNVFRISVRSEDTEGIFGDYGKDWAAQFSQGTLLAFHVSGKFQELAVDLQFDKS